MASSADADLDRHRLRFRFNGFPIFDSDGDDVVGFVSEPEWAWMDLSAEQQAQVRRDAMRLQAGRSLRWEEAFSYTLGDYGIACPHEWASHDLAWRECLLCRMAELLPGIVVAVGGRTMRVPDPPPAVIRLPVVVAPAARMIEPDDRPGDLLVVEEYWWDGRGYVPASVYRP